MNVNVTPDDQVTYSFGNGESKFLIGNYFVAEIYTIMMMNT